MAELNVVCQFFHRQRPNDAEEINRGEGAALPCLLRLRGNPEVLRADLWPPLPHEGIVCVDVYNHDWSSVEALIMVCDIVMISQVPESLMETQKLVEEEQIAQEDAAYRDRQQRRGEPEAIDALLGDGAEE